MFSVQDQSDQLSIDDNCQLIDDGEMQVSAEEVVLPEGSFALLATVVQNPIGHYPVSAVAFDPYEELLWTANSAGRVVSYYGAGIDRYTAFAVSPIGADVRAIEPIETGVITLTGTQLKHNRRGGIGNFVHSSSNCVDMQCMHRIANSSKLVIGGNQSKMLMFDLETRKELHSVNVVDSDCVVLRSSSKFIFNGDSYGKITMRSLQSLEPTHTIQAHKATISDMDVCGTKLITCGCSPRMGQLNADRFVMVYDLRTCRPLLPLTVNIAPSFIRFLSAYSDNRIIIASSQGQMQAMEMGTNCGYPFQIDTNGSVICCLDVSPSNQCVAFGDAAGCVHVFSDRAQPIFNEHAWPTEFADPVMPIPSIPLDDDLAPLAIVPMPFSADGTYLSDWPAELCKRVYRWTGDGVAILLLIEKVDHQLVGGCNLNLFSISNYPSGGNLKYFVAKVFIRNDIQRNPS